jgi:ATP-binding cassette subfamily F protein uup
MSRQVLVDLVGVGASRPGRDLLSDVDLTVHRGDRVGIVGINGTGKSTLMGIISGRNRPETGTVRRSKDLVVAELTQRPDLGSGTVAEAIGGGWEAHAVADRLGMGALLDAPVASLSGGQLKRAALARALAVRSDLLLLDEPTNHLDLDAIAWLEERLAAYQGGLMLITHDRHVLDAVSTSVVELERGNAHRHEGGYSGYLAGKALRESRAAEAETVRRNLAKRELEWLRRGAPARTSKPKARIATAEAITQASAPKGERGGGLALHGDTPPPRRRRDRTGRRRPPLRQEERGTTPRTTTRPAPRRTTPGQGDGCSRTSSCAWTLGNGSASSGRTAQAKRR